MSTPKKTVPQLVSTPLRYHRLTLELLDAQPVPSKAALRKLEAWEKRWKTRLPASVREWYTIERPWEQRESPQVDDFFGGFHLTHLDAILTSLTLSFQRVGADAPKWFTPAYLGEGFDWLVRLDGSDDPPLEEGLDAVMLEVPGIKNEVELFSTFMFKASWVFLTGWVPGCGLEARAEHFLKGPRVTFGPMELDYLTERSTPGIHRLIDQSRCRAPHPITKRPKWFPTRSRLRFFVPGARIQIECEGNPFKAETKASWAMCGDSAESLFDFACQLWGCGNLFKKLSSLTETGQTVLRSLRRRFRKR